MIVYLMYFGLIIIFYFLDFDIIGVNIKKKFVYVNVRFFNCVICFFLFLVYIIVIS